MILPYANQTRREVKILSGNQESEHNWTTEKYCASTLKLVSDTCMNLWTLQSLHDQR
jgi:hypothetical protein